MSFIISLVSFIETAQAEHECMHLFFCCQEYAYNEINYNSDIKKTIHKWKPALGEFIAFHHDSEHYIIKNCIDF